MTEFGIVMEPSPGNTARLAAGAEQLGFDILLSPDTQNLSPDPIGQQNAELKVALLSIAMCLPGVVYLPLASTGQWALMAMIPASIGPAMTTASGSIAVINVTPNQIRGQTMALYLLTISLLGLSLGPTAVALLTDYVFKDPAMIDWSVSCVVIAS